MSQVKTFEGSSIEELLPQIRAELGDDAIVVRQREGLKGGVGGFFQKRVVEVEARAGSVQTLGTPDAEVRDFPGQSVPMQARAAAPEPAMVAPSVDVTDGPDATPEGFVPFTVSDYQSPRQSGPAPVAPAPIAPAPAAQPVAPAFAEHLAQADTEHAQQAAEAGRPLTVEEILTGVVVPTPAATPAPAPVAAAATPKVVATPVPEIDEGTAEGEPPALAAIPTPAPAAAPVAHVPAPPPAVIAVPVAAPVAATPGRARGVQKVIDTLIDRGLDAEYVEMLVDGLVMYRMPLLPGARIGNVAARELASRIPVTPLGRPGVSAWVGTGGAGKSTAIGALARAYAQAGTVPVACIALHSPDGGQALRIALQASGVEVFVARDEDESAALSAQLTSSGRTVLVDTPAISPKNPAEIKSLARRLRRAGVTDVHVCIPATLGHAVARDVIEAVAPLRPTALTITHSDETDRLGAVVQMAIDTGLPVSYVAAVESENGHVLRAADATDLAKALVG